MDKYEYRVKTEQMLEYYEHREFDKAMEIADTVDWRRIKNSSMLSAVSEIYEYNGEFQKSRDILFVAYDRAPGNRKIIYRLGTLALRLGQINEAVDCYEEFMAVAPKDPNQYILHYKILKAQNSPLAEQIKVLEDFKKAEYIEKWAFELAELYHKAGMTSECLEECDDLILWFSEGKYVYQAMELKMRYKPLTPLQQEKYNQRNAKVAQKFKQTAPKQQAAPQQAEAEQAEDKQMESTQNMVPSGAQELSLEKEPEKPKVIKRSAIQKTVAGASLAEAISAGLSLAQEEGKHPEEAEAEPVPEDQEALIQQLMAERSIYEAPTERIPDLSDVPIVDKEPIVLGNTGEIKASKQEAKQVNAVVELEPMEEPETDIDLEFDDEPESKNEPEALAEVEHPAIGESALELVQETVDATQEGEPERMKELETAKLDLANELEKLDEPVIERSAPEEKAQPQERRAVRTRKNPTVSPVGTLDELESQANDVVDKIHLTGKMKIEEILQSWEARQKLVAEELERQESLKAGVIPPKPKKERKVATPADVQRLLNELEGGAKPEAESEEDVTPVEDVMLVEDLAVAEDVIATPEAKEADETDETVQEASEDYEQVAFELDSISPDVEEDLEEEDFEEADEFEEDDEFEEAEDFEEDDEFEEAEDFEEDEELEEAEDFEEDDEFEEAEDFEEDDEFEEAEDFEEEDEFEEAEDFEEDDEFEEADEFEEDEEFEEDDEFDDDDAFEEDEDFDDEFEEADEFDEEDEEDFDEDEFESVDELADEFDDDFDDELEEEEDDEDELSLDQFEIAEPSDEEIEARMKKSEGGVSFDTGFVVQGRYDLSATSEIGLKAGLTEDQKKLFSYFVPVRGMSDQLVEVLDHDKGCKSRKGTSRTGNLLIIGRKGSGKTVLAVDVVKAIQKQRKIKGGKVAIVTGDSLNKKELSDVVRKLKGGAIIIEKAGRLNSRTVQELDRLLERPTGEMLVVLEEQRKPLEKMLNANPKFREKFTMKLELPVFINDELVTFGQTYAKENGYRIDEMGILALYSRIDLMQREDHAVTVAEVKEIMDEAIEHSQKANMKKLVKRVFGKGTDETDRIILTEKDFNE